MAAADGAAGPDAGAGRRAPRPAPVPARRAADPLVRLLLTLTFVLALVAAVVVVLAEDGRLLRLGVVAGLWAALLAVAAFARRSAGPDEAAVAAREEAPRRTYELELAAEVDARRGHELTVEQAVRREVASETAEEIAGLRAELERLRSHLERDEVRAAPRLQAVAGAERWAPVARPTPPPSRSRRGPPHAIGDRGRRR
ncbi:MAG TPA: DUF6779 domain-containing protein [Actinomycetospora sp.]|jgi:hypothetical protein|uniref:DUF6779 domain-containing protein n=1 Tax=Actinomycetospora sp. TaxID=1872135 RepID=UPI002F4205BF